MAGNKFTPDILHRVTGVGWAGGLVGILDTIEPRYGIPDGGEDYILSQAPQVKILKPMKRSDFVGAETTNPNVEAFDSDPRDTGYVDSGKTTLPTKDEFAKGYVFYTREKISTEQVRGGYYVNWIVNLAKLRDDAKAQAPPPRPGEKPEPFLLDIAMQRIYFHAFPGGDAWPSEPARWAWRIYAIPIEKFAVNKEDGHIDPIKNEPPTGVAELVVTLPQEGEPGFKAPSNVVMPIKEHALFNGVIPTFAEPKNAP